MKLLITLGKIGTKEEFVQQAYRKFSASCLNSQSNVLSVKRDFRKLGDLFVRTNELKSLCEETVKLSEKLKTDGNTRLSDLLISELSKVCIRFNMTKKAEELLNLAIENSRKKNDGLHELARLVDLEKIYRRTGDRKSLLNVLGRKKECCKKIMVNYENNAANFDSVMRKPTPKEGVAIQLAFAYSDLASMIERRKPQDAIKMYKKSKEIYDSLNRPSESAYLDKKIIKILKKYNLSDNNT